METIATGSTKFKLGGSMATKRVPPSDQSEGMSILQVLTQLKGEIISAQDEAIGRKEAPMFSIDEGELELKFVVKREQKTDGSGKVSFKLYVLDAELAAGASRTGTVESSQTLKLKFKALRPGTRTTVPGEHIGQETQSIPGSLDPLSPTIQLDPGISFEGKAPNTR
jgi:hypothetical protein